MDDSLISEENKPVDYLIEGEGQNATISSPERVINDIPEAAVEKAKSSRELVETKLRPQDIQDQAGFSRRIYSFITLTGKETKFSLRGRYELPETDSSFKDIGTKPLDDVFVGNEFQSYKSSHRSEAERIQTTKDFEGFIALSDQLIPDNPRVEQAKQDIQNGVYSDDTITFINELVATSIIDDKGLVNSEINADAEALMILALSGNAEAQRLVQSKSEALLRMDDEKKQRAITEGKLRVEGELKDVPDADMSRHSLVHIYEGPVERDEHGNVILRSTAYRPKAAPFGQVILRDTIHTSIDGPVGEHDLGSWDDIDTVVVAKAKNNIDKADTIRPEDTYFHIYPHQALTLEEATGIVPGEVPEDAIISKLPDGKTILYRRNGFTVRHLQEYLKLNPEAPHALTSILNNETFVDLGSITETVNALTQSLNEDDASLRAEPALTKGLINVYSKAGVERLQSKSKNPSDSEFPTLSREEIAKRIAHLIIGRLPTEIRNTAVKEAIRDQGSEMHTIMAHGWQNEHDIEIIKYALERGISTGEHINTIASETTDKIADAFESAGTEGGIDNNYMPSWGDATDDETKVVDVVKYGYNWKKYSYSPTPKEILELAPQTRADIYDSGVLTARI